MNKKADDLEQLSQNNLAKYTANEFRLTILHYGLWFSEIVHQQGLEAAIQMEEKVFNLISAIAVKRLSRTLGFKAVDGLPSVLTECQGKSCLI